MLGSLEAGKLADFVVLSHDIMRVPAQEILTTMVSDDRHRRRDCVRALTKVTAAGAWTTAAGPPLPPGEWADTRATLHRWLQIVGKIRMVQTPPVNHSWHVTFPSRRAA